MFSSSTYKYKSTCLTVQRISTMYMFSSSTYKYKSTCLAVQCTSTKVDA